MIDIEGANEPMGKQIEERRTSSSETPKN